MSTHRQTLVFLTVFFLLAASGLAWKQPSSSSSGSPSVGGGGTGTTDTVAVWSSPDDIRASDLVAPAASSSRQELYTTGANDFVLRASDGTDNGKALIFEASDGTEAMRISTGASPLVTIPQDVPFALGGTVFRETSPTVLSIIPDGPSDRLQFEGSDFVLGQNTSTTESLLQMNADSNSIQLSIFAEDADADYLDDNHLHTFGGGLYVDGHSIGAENFVYAETELAAGNPFGPLQSYGDLSFYTITGGDEYFGHIEFYADGGNPRFDFYMPEDANNGTFDRIPWAFAWDADGSPNTLTFEAGGGRVTDTVVEVKDFSGAGDITVTYDRNGGTPFVGFDAPLDMGANKVSNMAIGTLAGDAVTKAQLDAVSSGLFVKEPVRLATLGVGMILDSNADISAALAYDNVGGASNRGQITATLGVADTFSIDGTAVVTDDRILIAAEGESGGLGGDANGCYTVDPSGTSLVMDRCTDYDEDAEVVSGTYFLIREGTVHGAMSHVLVTNDPVTIGGASGTALTYVMFNYLELADAVSPQIDLGDSGVVGTAGQAAREDHQHAVDADFVGNTDQTGNDREIPVYDGAYNRITNTGISVSASNEVTIPSGGWIQSEETGAGTVTYRVGDSATTGLGYTGSAVALYRGASGVAYNGSSFFPTDVNDDIGILGVAGWDDLTIDDIFLQRTTATEGIIHGAGVSGDDELQIFIDNTSGAYDAWGFKFATLPGGAASVTSARITSSGIVLPDNMYALSEDLSLSHVAYRVNNDDDTGLGLSSVASQIALWVDGTEAWRASTTIIATLPLIPNNATGSFNLGTNAFTWDDFYVDDIYHQQTTAGEGREFWEGSAGNETWKLEINNDGGQYDEMVWWGPASPASGASVQAMRLTTTQSDINSQVRLGQQVGLASNYALSIQNTGSPGVWLELLNSTSSAGQGSFFGMDNVNFEVWNYQGGDVIFYTDPSAGSGNVRLRINSTGQVDFSVAARPATNGTPDLGSTSLSWDDAYIDNLFLQQTTPGEASISWEGISTDATWDLLIDNTSGVYDEMVWMGPASPASGASIESMRITSEVVKLHAGGIVLEQHIVRIKDTEADTTADHPLAGSPAPQGADSNNAGYLV